MTEAQQDAAIKALQTKVASLTTTLNATRTELASVHTHCRDLVDIFQNNGFRLPEFDSIPPTP